MAEKNKNVVKNTTISRERKTKKAKVDTKKSKGNNQYTKSDKWYGESYEDTRVKLKVYLDYHPVKHQKLIEGLVKDAIKGDPTARKLVIGMSGGEDPKETKDVTEHAIHNPFENLTEEELRKLAETK